MEKITIGEIYTIITFVIAFIGAIGVIYKKVKGVGFEMKKIIKDTLKDELSDIKKNLKEESLSRCKSDLVVIMSRIQNGYVPTREEVMVLYETKTKYNKLGGDSYIDDMFDKLKKEGKL
jgi:hypothetical protein